MTKEDMELATKVAAENKAAMKEAPKAVRRPVSKALEILRRECFKEAIQEVYGPSYGPEND